MPIYEYECEECGRIEEALQKFSDPPLATCGKCAGKLNRIVSQSSFHLKGTGWYVTDYAKKSSSAPRDSSDSDSGKTETKSAGQKTEKTTSSGDTST